MVRDFGDTVRGIRSQRAIMTANNTGEVATSKYMRLGSGLSSIGKSPLLSCFDVELFAEDDISDQSSMSESELLLLFGLNKAEEEMCGIDNVCSINPKMTT